jgi:hypothetical protein
MIVEQSEQEGSEVREGSFEGVGPVCELRGEQYAGRCDEAGAEAGVGNLWGKGLGCRSLIGLCEFSSAEHRYHCAVGMSVQFPALLVYPAPQAWSCLCAASPGAHGGHAHHTV